MFTVIIPVGKLLRRAQEETVVLVKLSKDTMEGCQSNIVSVA